MTSSTRAVFSSPTTHGSESLMVEADDRKQLARTGLTEMTAFDKPWLKAHYTQDTILNSEVCKCLVPAAFSDDAQ